jgi:hypothetical protein
MGTEWGAASAAEIRDLSDGNVALVANFAAVYGTPNEMTVIGQRLVDHGKKGTSVVNIDRNTTNRAAINGSPYVKYDETAALLWLGEVAEDYDVDGEWPHRFDDDRLVAVTNLAEAAVIAGIIKVDDERILSAGYEFVCGRNVVLAGARLLVCTTGKQLELVDDTVWASELIDDELGVKGALNALWNTAWGIHNLMTKLADHGQS